MSFNWDSVLKSLGEGVKKSYEKGLETYYSDAPYKSKEIYSSYINFVKPASDMLKTRKSRISSLLSSEEYKNAEDDELKAEVYSLLEYTKDDKDIMNILDQEIRISKNNIQTEMDSKLFYTMNNLYENMKEMYHSFAQIRQDIAYSCQQCGFSNPGHKKFCTKCGAEIVFFDLQQYQEMRRKQQEKEERKKANEERKRREFRMRKFVCTVCGQENETGAAFCAECGNLTYHGRLLDLQKRLSNGDGEAAYELAHIFWDGDFVEENDERAQKYFKTAIELGSAAAMFEWGFHFIDDDDEKMVSKAISYIKQAAQSQYPPAETYLGTVYILGDILEQDEQLGLKYLFDAEKHGDPEAKCTLAGMYIDGYLLEQDTEKALKLLDEALEMGNDEAKYRMGVLYLDGDVIEKDEKKGLQLIEEAAKNDNPSALYDLGIFYSNGKYFEKNEKKAIKCFERAVQCGNTDAYFEYGKRLLEGNGVKQNIKKGLQLLHTASDYIDDAKIYLGYVYSCNSYVKEDYDKALSMISNLVDEENPEALYIAGAAYMAKSASDLGNIDRKEYDLAISLIKKAASLGHANAIKLINSINL